MIIINIIITGTVTVALTESQHHTNVIERLFHGGCDYYHSHFTKKPGEFEGIDSLASKWQGPYSSPVARPRAHHLDDLILRM